MVQTHPLDYLVNMMNQEITPATENKQRNINNTIKEKSSL